MNHNTTPTSVNGEDNLLPDEKGKQNLKLMFDKIQAKVSYKDDNNRDYAGWTLPYLYTEDETTGTEMQYDYQALGAQLVNNLANKIVQVLFPQGRPFFKLQLTDEEEDKLTELNIPQEQIDSLLSLAEMEIMRKAAKEGNTSAILEAVKNIMVLGNVLLHMPDKGKAQAYSMKDYVLLRDMSGEPYQIITRDTHTRITLPQDIKNMLPKGDDGNPEEVLAIYTNIQLTPDGRFAVWQEIEDMLDVPRKVGMYTKEDLPWIPLAWTLPRGYNMGVGLVEEFAGAFHTYSSLAEAQVSLASLVADIKILVDPSGSTDISDLNDTASGTFVYGREDDISYLNLTSVQDLQAITALMEVYSRQLAKGFLFTSEAVRNSERTTAEEIRILANELQGSLGGIYGRLAEDLQQPMAIRMKKKYLGKPFENVEPTIITGMESLSRNSELDSMLQFLNDAALLTQLPPELQDNMKFTVILTKLGAGRHLDYSEFLFTEQEAEANKQERLDREQPPEQPQQQPEPEII